MEDLLKKQIHENCNLSLPEGLKDLMADISREVLRYQPRDIYKFISDYLAAMLVARENLAVTSNVCSDVCNASCNPELQDELRYIGLDEADCKKAVKIIFKHFLKGKVVECNLLQKLVRKVESINVNNLPEVKQAIVNAFIRHKANTTVLYEWSSSDTEADEVKNAAHHTMKLYRKTAPSIQVQHVMAKRIQAAYRAYNLRLALCTDKIRKKGEKKSKIFRLHGSEEADHESIDECISKEEESSAESNVSSQVPTLNKNHESLTSTTEKNKNVAFNQDDVPSFETETESFERFMHPDLENITTTYDYDTETEVRSSFFAGNGINGFYSESDGYDNHDSSDDSAGVDEDIHEHNEENEVHEYNKDTEVHEHCEDNEENEHTEENENHKNYEENEDQEIEEEIPSVE